ncbi:MAG: hypothetical protein V2A73_19730, partial [Pseudomonadota bacterium]
MAAYLSLAWCRLRSMLWGARELSCRAARQPLFRTMQDLPPARSEHMAWSVLAAISLLGAVPYVACTYLPMVDLPLHQLELAIWMEPAGALTDLGRYYETGPWYLPYWLPLLAARFFALFAGTKAGRGLLLSAYAAALPLASGLVARAAGRSAWWGLAL